MGEAKGRRRGGWGQRGQGRPLRRADSSQGTNSGLGEERRLVQGHSAGERSIWGLAQTCLTPALTRPPGSWEPLPAGPRRRHYTCVTHCVATPSSHQPQEVGGELRPREGPSHAQGPSGGVTERALNLSLLIPKPVFLLPRLDPSRPSTCPAWSTQGACEEQTNGRPRGLGGRSPPSGIHFFLRN